MPTLVVAQYAPYGWDNKAYGIGTTPAKVEARYYRERAPEYDDWWFRRGRFDRGEEANARWFGEAACAELLEKSAG